MILGIDLGTSALKAIVVSTTGSPVTSSRAEYAVNTPRPGWAETDPELWWQALITAVQVIPEDIRQQVTAIGLSGQMHSLVLCSATGNPVRPAILWSDTRSESVLPTFKALGPAQRERLGNPIVAGMTGPSLLWLARHEPAAVESARWALQPKDWLRLRLTGVAATDPSDASATLLYDSMADGWAQDIMQFLALPAGLLPPIRASDAVGGELAAAPAGQLGLQPGIPVAIGAGDTPAAALGTGLVNANDAQLSLGTGAQIIVIGEPGGPGAGNPEPAVHRFRSALKEQHYTMAAMQNAGLALNWVRSILGFTWEELHAAFDPSGIPADLVFLPYLTGERTPFMDAGLRATWTGMALHHTREDLAAATLAGVALAIRDGLQALRDAGAEAARLRVSGGGSQAPGFTQFLCDLLAVPLQPTETPDASALGAARLAAGMLQQDFGSPGRAEANPDLQFKPRPLTQETTELLERFQSVQQRLL
jgi:xylulokinase